MKDRIKAFMAYRGIGQSKFEKLAGLSNGTINNIKNGLGVRKAEQVLSAFPELSRVWLFTGEGEMVNYDNHRTTINIDDSDKSDNSAITHGDNSPALSGGSTLNQCNDQSELVAALRSQVASLEGQLASKDEKIRFLQNLINNK